MPEVFNCPDCAGPSKSPPMIYDTVTFVQGTSTLRCMQCVRTWETGLFHERFIGKGTVNPPEPSAPPLILTPRDDLEAQMGPDPSKSPAVGDFNPPKQKAKEAPIQTADQNKYNEQVDKAHKELILLMAFNNCTEENVRDILIRISSNCYAMGYQEGLDRKK